MNIEDIKRKVFNRIKDDQEYKEIPEKYIIQWINEIPISEFKPYTITDVKEEIDWKNLFNRKVSETIDFLSQYKDYIIEERWSDYEHNYFVFVIERPETSDEIIERIYDIVDIDCRAFLRQEEQIADIDKQIREFQNKKKEIERRVYYDDEYYINKKIK